MGNVMVRFTVIALLAFSISILGAIIYTPPSSSNWGETIRSIGVAVSATAGIVTPLLTIMMARYQQELTGSLEKLKNEYSKNLELTKGALSENLEMRKAEIAGQVRAFDSMLSAAHFFYFVLREQVNDKIAGGDALFVEANKKAAEASASLWHLPEDDKQIWYQVYQRSKYLSDLIKHFDGPDKIEVFQKNAAELGSFINKLEYAGQRVFEEAKKLKLDQDSIAPAKQSSYLYGLH